MWLADVALPLPVARLFTYEVSEAIRERMAPGKRVICPFSGRKLVGIVLAVREGEPPKGVKPIAAVVDDEPALPSDLLAFVKDVSSYYLAPIGEVAKLATPPLERRAAEELTERTLFSKPAGISDRFVQWAVATDRVEGGGGKTENSANSAKAAKAVRGQAQSILMHVRSIGAAPVAALEQTWKNARKAVQSLAQQGYVRLEDRAAPAADFFRESAPSDTSVELTAAQRDAVRALGDAIAANSAATFLVHGVTGSGKTEVYLRAIAAAREAKRGTIVLVPEIALTPQLVSRYRARFGDDVAVIHSALTPKERFQMWKRLRLGEVDVAIGARSALFSPVRNLGLVIVDEEHDSSFKQEEGVRYHARDMAILRAHRVSGVCILGSATPSLESEHLSRTGKATKLRLPDRARAQSMPAVEIVDLRRIGAGPTGDKRLSLPLHRAIETALAAKEQVILFLNRRGFAPSILCESCGHMASCPSCSVALTFHKRDGSVVRCHYCDYRAPMITACPSCESREVVLEGLGTERLEETLRAAFPDARIARLDRDTATGRTVERVLSRVRAREVDILVGTQMVAKGHDLPHVTLVGVINADSALSIPDFRAGERAFQLIVQVAGRAGRGDLPGRVLVQTFNPEHHALTLAAKHNVDGFLERELIDRKELLYPPYSRLALIRVDAVSIDVVVSAAHELTKTAREAVVGKSVEVIGPAPAPIARVRDRFRFRIMLRAVQRSDLRTVLLAIERARGQLPSTVRTSIDVDPVQML